MIDISAEQINLLAPYKCTRIATNSFVFESQYGVRINVGFADDYMLMNEGAYQLFISNSNNQSSPNDPLVRETIACIIKQFLESEPAVVLYICDTSDDRQNIRDRLFSRWFHNYCDISGYTFVQESVRFEDTEYFGSIILRLDHPLHDEVISAFHDFVKDLPEKLNSI